MSSDDRPHDKHDTAQIDAILADLERQFTGLESARTRRVRRLDLVAATACIGGLVALVALLMVSFWLSALAFLTVLAGATYLVERCKSWCAAQVQIYVKRLPGR